MGKPSNQAFCCNQNKYFLINLSFAWEAQTNIIFGHIDILETTHKMKCLLFHYIHDLN